MTLAQSTRYKKYQPTVAQTDFLITFPIFDDDDVQVFLDGVETTLFSISATYIDGRASDASIILNTAKSSGTVEIYGDREPRRTNNYLGNSPDLAKNLQNDVDAVTAVQQEQRRSHQTSLRVSGNDTIAALQATAAARAGKIPIFTSTGLGFELGPDADEVTNAQGYALAAQAAANSLGVSFDTMAGLIASTEVTIGQIVETKGYTAAGDGGGAWYQIVAAGTGTADGGSFINLSGITGQAKLLLTEYNPVMFGAAGDGVTDDQSAWAAMLVWDQTVSSLAYWLTNPNSNFPSRRTIDGLGKIYALGSGLDFEPDNTNLIVQNASFKAIAGTWDATIGSPLAGGVITATTDFDFPSGDYMFNCKANATFVTFRDLAIDCNDLCSGIKLRYGCIAEHIDMTRIGGYGIRSVGGNTKILNNEMEQWNKDDPEYYIRERYTGVGIFLENSDALVMGNKVRWCWTCCVDDNTNNRLTTNHFFNGMRDFSRYEDPDDSGSGASRSTELNDAIDTLMSYASGTAAVTNFPPRLHHAAYVKINSSGSLGGPDSIISDMYIDNTHIDIYDPGVLIDGLFVGAKETSSLSAPIETSPGAKDGLPSSFPAEYQSGILGSWVRFFAYAADCKYKAQIGTVRPMVEGVTKKLFEMRPFGGNSWDLNTTFAEALPQIQSSEMYGDAASVMTPSIEWNLDQKDSSGISRPVRTTITCGAGAYRAFGDKNSTDYTNLPRYGGEGDDAKIIAPGKVLVEGAGFGYVPFASRAAAVSAVADMATGTVFQADGLWYVKDGTTTDITDMSGVAPMEPYFVDHFGDNTTPGTTNMTAAMIAAATYMINTGRTLYMRAETYLFNKATSGFFNINGFHLVGAGIGQTSIDSATPDSSAALQIRGTSASITGVSVTNYPRLQVQTGTDLRVIDCEFECSNNISSVWESLVAISDAADIDGLLIEGCWFHHGLLGIFTANAFGTTGNQITSAVIRNNRFSNTRKTGISINSDFATSAVNQPWQDVLIEGNTFRDYAGEAGDNAAAIAFDNAADLRIVDNKIEDYGNVGSGTGDAGDYAIHLENLGRRVRVTGNQISNARRGIVIYGGTEDTVVTDNIVVGDEGNVYADDPSTFTTPAYGFAEKNGIYVVTDGDGEVDRVRIAGNQVSNFNNGLRLGGNQRAFTVQGNTVALCSVGAALHNNTLSGVIEGNVFDRCRYVYALVDSTSAVRVGHNEALYCDELLDSSTLTGGTLWIGGLDWCMKGLAVVGNANTAFDMFAIPTMIDCSDGKVSAQMFRLTTPEESTVSSLSLTYDGTTVTGSLDFVAPVASVANTTKPAATTPFQNTSGRLECRIFVGGSSPTNDGTAEATFSFNGPLAYAA